MKQVVKSIQNNDGTYTAWVNEDGRSIAVTTEVLPDDASDQAIAAAVRGQYASRQPSDVERRNRAIEQELNSG
jgi:hypothetical protein